MAAKYRCVLLVVTLTFLLYSAVCIRVNEGFPVLSKCFVIFSIQLFHWSGIPDEFSRIYKRLGNLKYLIAFWITWLLKIIFLRILGPKWVGFHCAFGDGSEIPEHYLSHLRDVVWNNLVFNRWELGDMLLLDNFRVSHGRQVGGFSSLINYLVM